MVWDNLTIQHAGTEQADLVKGKRDMQRVTLHDIGLSEVEERAWQHQEPPLPA
jgi:alpha-ketoglutarate-dependent taurine dioxygenase